MSRTNALCVIDNNKKTGPYSSTELVIIFSVFAPSSPPDRFLFLHIGFFGVWWKAEVLFHVFMTVHVSIEQDNGPSRERGHVVTTRDLNRCLQSFTVAVQQSNTVLLLTGCIDTDIL